MSGTTTDVDVLIVGAGVSGLTCARRLHERGVATCVVEAADAVGGRVRSEQIDGFILDRGFQVLLSAYPEAKRWLDLDALDLRPLVSGARVHTPDGPRDVIRPRVFSPAIGSTLASLGPVFRLGDAPALLRLLAWARADAPTAPERTTLERLRECGISDRAIDRLFRPFFGGVLFDHDLDTSDTVFRFLFRMFAEGEACVPAGGMGRIPEQLAAALPNATLRLNQPCERAEPGLVRLASGETIRARDVVVAADGANAHALLAGHAPPAIAHARWRSTVTAWFDAPASDGDTELLMLDGVGGGPVNHAIVLSRAAPERAPEGRALVALSTTSGRPASAPGELEREMLAQVRAWLGDRVDDWRPLRTHRIDRALPMLGVGDGARVEPDPARLRLTDGLWIACDHLAHGSINGAMATGRVCADAILATR